MGKIQKMGKWVPQLNERQQENQKTTCEMLFAGTKESHFFELTGDEK